MIGFIKSHFENKRKAAHEKELKAALARKFEHYDDMQTDDDNTDYTIVEIGGQMSKVVKEHITIFDIDAPPLEA